jgi:hypothetical protein
MIHPSFLARILISLNWMWWPNLILRLIYLDGKIRYANFSILVLMERLVCLIHRGCCICQVFLCYGHQTGWRKLRIFLDVM